MKKRLSTVVLVIMGILMLVTMISAPSASARVRYDYDAAWTSDTYHMNGSHTHAFQPDNEYWAVRVHADCGTAYFNWGYVNYQARRIHDDGVGYTTWRSDSLYVATNYWPEGADLYEYYHTPDRTNMINGFKPFEIQVWGSSAHTENGGESCSWWYRLYNYHCTQQICAGRGNQRVLVDSKHGHF